MENPLAAEHLGQGLPDDVLFQVFSELVTSSEITDFPLEKLLQVSHAWKSLAENPTLWTKINVSGSSQKVEAYLKRSGTCLISLISPDSALNSSTLDEVDEQTPELLVQHMHRVKSIELSLELSALRTVMQHLWREPAPELRVLALYCYQGFRLAPFIGGPAFRENAPKLETLTLVGLNFRNPLRCFPNLLHLTIRGQELHILPTGDGSSDDIMTRPPLQTLTILLVHDADLREEWTSSDTPLELQHLVALQIVAKATTIYKLLSRLKYPVYCAVMTMLASPPYEPDLAAIVPRESSSFYAISQATCLVIETPRLNTFTVCAYLLPESPERVFSLGVQAPDKTPIHTSLVIARLGSYIPLPRILHLVCSPRIIGRTQEWIELFSRIPQLRTLTMCGSYTPLKFAPNQMGHNPLNQGELDVDLVDVFRALGRSSSSTVTTGSTNVVLPALTTLVIKSFSCTEVNVKSLAEMLRERKNAGATALVLLHVHDVSERLCADVSRDRWNTVRQFTAGLVLRNNSTFGVVGQW